jgi:hypothetical protein
MEMKQFFKSVLVALFLATIVTLPMLSGAQATESATQEKARTFVLDVLPLDTSKYQVVLAKDSISQPLKPEPEQPLEELITYNMTSDENQLQATCKFRNEILTGCILSLQSGPPVSSTDIISSAKEFIQKYQIYTKSDLTPMLKTLNAIDTPQNITVTQDNVKLRVESQKITTSFHWRYTINGADYMSFGITFENGMFYALRDDRGLFTIGNTDVNITKEEAVDIAMKYIGKFSYTGITGDYEKPTYVQISGFNISEDQTTAELSTQTRNSSALFPYWKVTLNLNKFYPGNIYAFEVRIWADAGQVFLCQPLGVGGDVPDEDMTDTATIEPSPSQPAPPKPTPHQPPHQHRSPRQNRALHRFLPPSLSKTRTAKLRNYFAHCCCMFTAISGHHCGNQEKKQVTTTPFLFKFRSPRAVEAKKVKEKSFGASKEALGFSESFDVSVDFPFSDDHAVEVPFAAFFFEEVFKGCFAEGFFHEVVVSISSSASLSDSGRETMPRSLRSS